ncbi:MAG: serine O-acetyltransferase [Alphaproteobacteria bacterium]|nr:serine O-acetyltransferase [Alphaproteobacteria bacterium]
MTKHAHSSPAPDIWPQIRAEARIVAEKEPALAAFVRNSILSEEGLLPALAKILSAHLATPDVPADALHGVFSGIYRAAPELADAAARDLVSTLQNDPAAHEPATPFLFFKGYHALQASRVARRLWNGGRRHLALHLQNRMSELFGVDIHPAAAIGCGVMFDHATGIVIGETAVIEDDVLLWHGVTLGSKGPKATGDRHPKVRKGARLGAHVTILGPVEVGADARVAAGSVVMEDVAAGATVSGNPAETVKLSR